MLQTAQGTCVGNEKVAWIGKKSIHLLHSPPILPVAVKCAGCAHISGVWRGSAVHLLEPTAVS